MGINTNDDIELLNQKIEIILSNKISKNFKYYDSDHNKIIIEGIQ